MEIKREVEEKDTIELSVGTKAKIWNSAVRVVQWKRCFVFPTSGLKGYLKRVY